MGMRSNLRNMTGLRLTLDFSSGMGMGLGADTSSADVLLSGVG